MENKELKVEWVVPMDNIRKLADWNIEFSASVDNLGIVCDAAQQVMEKNDPYISAIFGSFVHMKKLADNMESLLDAAKSCQAVIVNR